MLYRELRNIEAQQFPTTIRDFEKSALDSLKGSSFCEVDHTPGDSVCENRLNSTRQLLTKFLWGKL